MQAGLGRPGAWTARKLQLSMLTACTAARKAMLGHALTTGPHGLSHAHLAWASMLVRAHAHACGFAGLSAWRVWGGDRS